MSGCPAATRAASAGVDLAVPLVVSCRGRGARRRGRRRRPSGLAQRLAVDGHDADALLAGGLGDELLEPGAQGRQVRLDDEGQLVAPGRASAAMATPSTRAGLSSRVGAREVGHDAGVLEQRVEVEAQQRRRHEAHVGQGAVAAAHVGRVEERLAEVARVRDGLQRRRPGRRWRRSRCRPWLRGKRPTRCSSASQRWARKASVSVVRARLGGDDAQRALPGRARRRRAATASGRSSRGRGRRGPCPTPG